MAERGARARDLAVVVVNYGSHEIVERNLRRTLEGDSVGHVVVVDNLSTTTERARIAAVCDANGWDLIAQPDNDGFGGGNNVGAAHAIERGAREILFINPDAYLEPGGARRLQEQVRADPMLQLSPEVVRPGGAIYAAEMHLHLRFGESRSARRTAPEAPADSLRTWVSGACFMMSAELWETVGGFDDDYFLYWEDVDLSRRVELAGGRVRSDPAVQAVHDEGATHRATEAVRVKSPIYYFYNCRNRLVYATKMLSPAESRRWLWLTPYASYRILLQGGRRQFVHPRLNLIPAIRGSWSGVRYWWARRRRDGRQKRP
ncbi:glycosyltransferase family 2 protein [Microbacterium koreense]|uniref:Glycosyltransferase family 2 protein n=1 Tax=Microbacterium koreense TaxID=323761 RepID=A0ABW2ZPB8_9MICO